MLGGATEEVVGQQSRGEPRVVAEPAQCSDHLGAHLASEQTEHLNAPDLVAKGSRFICESHVEVRDRDFAALETGPGVGVGIRLVDPAQEAIWEAVTPFIGGECLER